MWIEWVAPFLLAEFVSGDGSDELDSTPMEGKFWVYENVIRPAYYAIFDGFRATLQVFRLDVSRLVPQAANAAGRFAIPELGIELGLWHGQYLNMTLPWLRQWSTGGELLPTAAERLADFERETRPALDRAERLAARLRELGVDPESL